MSISSVGFTGTVEAMNRMFANRSDGQWEQGEYFKAAWSDSKRIALIACSCIRGNIARQGEKNCLAKTYTAAVWATSLLIMPVWGPLYCMIQSCKSCCEKKEERMVEVMPQGSSAGSPRAPSNVSYPSEPNSPGPTAVLVQRTSPERPPV